MVFNSSSLGPGSVILAATTERRVVINSIGDLSMLGDMVQWRSKFGLSHFGIAFPPVDGKRPKIGAKGLAHRLRPTLEHFRTNMNHLTGMILPRG